MTWNSLPTAGLAYLGKPSPYSNELDIDSCQIKQGQTAQASITYNQATYYVSKICFHMPLPYTPTSMKATMEVSILLERNDSTATPTSPAYIRWILPVVDSPDSNSTPTNNVLKAWLYNPHTTTVSNFIDILPDATQYLQWDECFVESGAKHSGVQRVTLCYAMTPLYMNFSKAANSLLSNFSLPFYTYVTKDTGILSTMRRVEPYNFSIAFVTPKGGDTCGTLGVSSIDGTQRLYTNGAECSQLVTNNSTEGTQYNANNRSCYVYQKDSNGNQGSIGGNKSDSCAYLNRLVSVVDSTFYTKLSTWNFVNTNSSRHHKSHLTKKLAKCFPINIARDMDSNGMIDIDPITQEPIDPASISYLQGNIDSADESTVSPAAVNKAKEKKQNANNILYIIIYVLFGITALIIVIYLVHMFARSSVGGGGGDAGLMQIAAAAAAVVSQQGTAPLPS